MQKRIYILTLLFLFGISQLYAQTPLKTMIPVPEGYTRVAAQKGFPSTLGELPLYDQEELLAGDGKTVLCEDEKVAVTRILPFDNKHDVGVDGPVRMWGEYLWEHTPHKSISFPLDNGQVAKWSEWQEGLRPVSRGGKFIFTQETTPDGSINNYRRYLAFVAEEMGAIALKRESQIVFEDSIAVGDLLVTVRNDGSSWVGMVLDICKARLGEKLYLLGTCGTPSTTFYIMRPYSPVQGVHEWFTLEGAKYAVGAGARVDFRRVKLSNQ